MAIDLNALKTELETDPLTLGYTVSPTPPDNEADAYTDADILNSLTTGRTRQRTSIPGSEAFKATVDTEYDALTIDQRQEWLGICAIDELEPANGKPAASTVIRLFGGGSGTTTALQALRTETISRAQELFGTDVVPGDIQAARLI